MIGLISSEIRKIIARPRTYIGLGAILAITSLIHIAMVMDGKTYIGFITQNLEGSFSISGQILNGYLVAFIILQTLIVHIPMLVTLITGDLISGEAAMGTMRLMLTKKYSRVQILIAKYISGIFYSFIVLIWIALLSLGLGLLIFGAGDLVVLKSEQLTILQQSDVLWRFFGAFGLAFMALVVVASISFMFSCFSDNSIGPIVITMSIIFLFTIVGTIEIPFFDMIRPFLFTSHIIAWRFMFDDVIELQKIINSVIIMFIHIFLFLGISIYHFKNKDILS